MPGTEQQYLTKEKYDSLVKELEVLKSEKRKEVAENLEYAKSLGDLSENAEYHEARAMQAELEDRIAKLEGIIKMSVIVPEKRGHGDKVEIGSKIVLEKEPSRDKVAYTIVGSEEVDLAQNKISSASPLGLAVSGKKKGERISIKTLKGIVWYQIVSVE